MQTAPPLVAATTPPAASDGQLT